MVLGAEVSVKMSRKPSQNSAYLGYGNWDGLELGYRAPGRVGLAVVEV